MGSKQMFQAQARIRPQVCSSSRGCPPTLNRGWTKHGSSQMLRVRGILHGLIASDLLLVMSRLSCIRHPSSGNFCARLTS